MPQHAFDCSSIKMTALINDFQEQLLTRDDKHTDRRVRLLNQIHGLNLKSGLARLRRTPVKRIIFKDEKAFKKRRTTRHFAPTLHLSQRAILILARLDLLCL